jgi:hypothetical protein
MATKVTFRKAEYEFFFNEPSGKVGRYLALRGGLIVRAAKAQVGVRTGALRASIHMRHARDIRGQYIRIGSAMNYALLHHEGSKPHMIKPDRAQVLRFTSRGRVMYAHAVMHPGTEPNRYLTDNLGLIK